MKINKIVIGAYGKLRDRSFDFSDGINVISGSNESGKSTLCSFIRYSLFGFSGKASKISASDKLKYMPWDGSAISGNMTVTSGDNSFRIERTHSAKGKLTVYDETMSPVDFGKEPGEALLGVDESTFSKTAFIRQKDVSGENMDGISEAVQNIILSADETVNTDKAQKKLNELKNLYRNRSRSTGKCYELSGKISTLNSDKEEAVARHRELLEAEFLLDETTQKIKANTKKLGELSEELSNIEGYEAKCALENIEKARAHVADCEALLEEAQKSASFDGVLLSAELLDRIDEALREYRTLDGAVESGEKDYISCKKQQSEIIEENDILRAFGTDKGFDASATLKNVKGKKAAAVIFFILSLLSFAFTVSFVFAPAIGAFLLLCAAANVIGVKNIAKKYGFKGTKALVSALKAYPQEKKTLEENIMRSSLISESIAKHKELRENARAALCELVKKYTDTDDPDKVYEELCRLRALLSDVHDRKTSLEAAISAHKALEGSYDVPSLEAAAATFSYTPERDRKTVEREIKFCENANALLSEKEKEYIKKASVHTSHLRKPSEIESELEALGRVLEECTLKADSLELAMSSLKEACESVREGLSPRISSRASELFCEITDGRYTSLSVSPDFSLGVEVGAITYSADFLSTGALDAAYIALRIALAESLYKDLPVLVFDETFAYFDDERLKNVRRILDRLSEKYQIFIFTCHERKHLSATIKM